MYISHVLFDLELKIDDILIAEVNCQHQREDTEAHPDADDDKVYMKTFLLYIIL
jgi:hypothetical protein